MPSTASPSSTDAAELLALLTLRLTPHLGPRRIESLRQHFGSAQTALLASPGDLRRVPGLDARSVTAMGQQEPARKANLELAAAREAHVTLLGRGLPDYPAALDALGDAPPVLWVRGPLPAFPVVPLSIGVVGTRAASPQAL